MADSAGIMHEGAPLRLTEWTSCGGCAAKWGKDLLAGLVDELPRSVDPALIIGLAPFDDAAVYRVSDDVALVSTTDFFPPLVDDAADFGAIAAANACSDVFAMGGRVVMAINVAAFPEHFPREAIVAIFDAAAAVVAEAGGTIAGGHTIRNPEPIFGLAVQGVVHPDRVFTKGGARVGDVLMLSKPLGTGIVLAGGDETQKAGAIAGMRRLNRAASEALIATGGVHAVTDVTGYALAGHGWEMAERSHGAFRIASSSLPLYPGAREIAARGVRTGGDARNRTAVGAHVRLAEGVDPAFDILAFDPQTSGGLLAAVDPKAVDELRGTFTVIGEVVDGEPELLIV
ncbi:MAG: selenide, water dikinase SelD [Ilumatobacteraceae bacterium]|nr:selenide, water dikinase SelD [Ilumatobacteraceae bacterium]